MKADLEHRSIVATPKMQADVDRLEAVYKSMVQTSEHVNKTMSCEAITDAPPPMEILPNVFALVMNGKPNFIGVRMCTHCLEIAEMSLRDLADIVRDLRNETERLKT